MRARRPHSQPAAATSGTPALPESCELKPSLRARKPHQGQVFLGSPCISSLALGFRTPRLPLLPVWEKGVGGMRGKRAPQRSGRHCGTTAFLALLLRLQASRRVRAGGARTQGISASSGRFFGKPLHFFSRFGLQDAQTPPSPLVGEGGWGDEGQTGAATEWSSLRDDRVSGAPSPVAGIPPGARRRRAHPGHLRFQRQVFWQAPAFLLSLWASGRPDSPFSPCGSLGADRTGVSHACCFLRLRPAGAHACRPGRCGAPGWRRVGRTANTRSTNVVHRRGPTPR
jgi:hypothetical protein